MTPSVTSSTFLSNLHRIPLRSRSHLTSATPTGALDDGLPPDRENLGPLRMKNGETDLILVRVNDSVLGPVWLISSETLGKVPALYKDIEKSWVERVMPQPLLDHDLFGISLAQWLLLLA